MRTTNYRDAGAFLLKTREALERHEVKNSLMLGLCLRLDRHPERIGIDPYFATVEDADGLAAAAMMTPPHKLIVHSDREDCGQALGAVARNLLEGGWPVPGVLGPSLVAETFAGIWSRVSGAEAKETFRCAVNRRYLESVIGALQMDREETVDIRFTDAHRAIVFSPARRPDYKTLLMPMRLEEG